MALNRFESKSLRPDSNPLADLSVGEADAERLMFPAELGEIGQYMTLVIVERRFGTRRATTPSEVGHTVIRLPLPNNLSTSYNAHYDTPETLGVTQVAAHGASRLAATVGQDINRLSAELSAGRWREAGVEAMAAARKTRSALPGAVDTGHAAEQAIGTVLRGGGATDVGRGVGLGLGRAVNPHLAVMFSGVGFRTHQFNYQFTPKSGSESESLQGIIKRLKSAALPKYGGGRIWFEYPDEFIITFKEDDYTFKIEKSVLESLSVNYHGGHIPAYFADKAGAPVAVDISMTFRETSIITRDEATEGY